MVDEVLYRQGNVLVRRQRLEPGEALPWHVDPYRRFAVVVQGTSLAIEYRDGGEMEHVPVHPGLTDWDEPTDRPHRGINTGDVAYEEITIFFLDSPDAVAQPLAEP